MALFHMQFDHEKTKLAFFLSVEGKLCFPGSESRAVLLKLPTERVRLEYFFSLKVANCTPSQTTC